MRTGDRYAAQNRRARHDYLIEDTVEAGLVLQGSEVKVLRTGQASIAEAYADAQAGELFLVNANIPEYQAAKHFPAISRAGLANCCLHRKEMKQASGRDPPRRRDDRPAVDLFQRARPRQGRARPRPRQEKSRQAGSGKEPRLAARQGAPHAVARLSRALSATNTASNISVVSVPVFVLSREQW